MLYFHHPLKTESPIMSKVPLFVPTNSQLRHSSKLDHLSPKVLMKNTQKYAKKKEWSHFIISTMNK